MMVSTKTTRQHSEALPDLVHQNIHVPTKADTDIMHPSKV